MTAAVTMTRPATDLRLVEPTKPGLAADPTTDRAIAIGELRGTIVLAAKLAHEQLEQAERLAERAFDLAHEAGRFAAEAMRLNSIVIEALRALAQLEDEPSETACECPSCARVQP